LEETPIGATVHFMNSRIDGGDIVHQKRLTTLPEDTADSLYKRVKQLELEVFIEVWPALIAGTFTRTPQDLDAGSFHARDDLFDPSVQRLDLGAVVRVETLLRRLRALTTNRVEEASYFDLDGKRYRVQVAISRDDRPL
jgi:methionyl-tRNA formyltransferase